jgi:hypothetical protein
VSGFRVISLLGIMSLIGCAPQNIDREYGKRRGSHSGPSVNGTAVLSELFQQAGYQVRTWRRLSPKLEQADVIVWIPDDFGLPTLEQREFLEGWLRGSGGRTLIYVGRDYEAGLAYWEFVRGVAPPSQAMEARRRLARVQSDYDSRRVAMPLGETCDWFTLRGHGAGKRVRELTGRWSEGIDASRVGIEVGGYLEPPDDPEIETLLASGDKPLVFRQTTPEGSRLISIVNGSFLLNLPLVNHEHRKLAGKLVSSCEPATKVVFLESGSGGPAILEKDSAANYSNGLEMFTVPPMGTILLHFALAGITFCFALFPIFGRPRELAVASTSDFGKHVSALGELLARTGDREYAINRLKYYNEHVRKD